MIAKTKRILAAVLAVVMILPNPPYGGADLVAYAANESGSLEAEQQIVDEDLPGESDDGSLDEEDKPDVGSVDEEDKAESGNTDNGEKENEDPENEDNLSGGGGILWGY